MKPVPERYRQRTGVRVMAVRLSEANAAGVAEWCKGELATDVVRVKGSGWLLFLPMPEGRRIAHPGDFIVLGPRGDFRVMRPEEFAAHYERAPE